MRELSKSAKIRLESARARVESTRLQLEAYIEAHAAEVEEYRHLMAAHEEAIGAAKILYKENVDVLGTSWAGFSAKETVELDAAVLLKLMGAAGEKYVKTKHVVDREAYYRGVESGEIPQSVIEAVETDIRVAISVPKVP